MNLKDSLTLKCYNKVILSRQSEVGKKSREIHQWNKTESTKRPIPRWLNDFRWKCLGNSTGKWTLSQQLLLEQLDKCMGKNISTSP